MKRSPRRDPNAFRSLGRRFRLERLEARQMMAGDLISRYGADDAPSYSEPFSGPLEHVADIVDWESGLPNDGLADDGLPVLNSRPGAPHTLFLNFRGNVVDRVWNTADYGPLQGLVTHWFNYDNDPGSFGAEEQAMVRTIWQIVSEDFAPFNVNVTTTFAGPLDEGGVIMAAIGPTNKDYLNITGVTRFNGFQDKAGLPLLIVTSNIQDFMATKAIQATKVVNGTYSPTQAEIDAVWDDVLWDSIIATGNYVSHEAGHVFGLQHHRYNGSEYYYGTDAWTPIMGGTAETDRMTWSMPLVNAILGPEGFTDVYEDELAILANVLGARPDDHGDSPDHATPLMTTGGTTLVNSGVIGTMDDVDVFSFLPQWSGNYQISIDVPEHGNLDAAFTLWDGLGPRIDAENEVSVRAEAYLEAGQEYFLRVMSHGVYGDLGHYTASVKLVAPEIDLMPELTPIPYIPELDLIDPAPDVMVLDERYFDNSPLQSNDGVVRGPDAIESAAVDDLRLVEAPIASTDEPHPLDVAAVDEVFAGRFASTFSGRVGRFA